MAGILCCRLAPGEDSEKGQQIGGGTDIKKRWRTGRKRGRIFGILNGDSTGRTKGGKKERGSTGRQNVQGREKKESTRERERNIHLPSLQANISYDLCRSRPVVQIMVVKEG